MLAARVLDSGGIIGGMRYVWKAESGYALNKD